MLGKDETRLADVMYRCVVVSERDEDLTFNDVSQSFSLSYFPHRVKRRWMVYELK